MAIGVVGYTTRFRTFTLEQLEATYRKIADLGYDGPEGLLGGRIGIPWEEDLKMIKKYGLKVADCHGDLEKPDETKKKADGMGTNIIGIGAIPGEMMNSVDGFKAYAEKMNKTAKNFKGYRLQYHNHAQEFRRFPNGKMGMDVLFDGFDPAAVHFLLDTHWVQAGGGDILWWLERCKGRIQYLHCKDYRIAPAGYTTDIGAVEKQFAQIGDGNLPWQLIVDTALEVGVKAFIVEQDFTYGEDPFDCAAASYAALSACGLR